MKKIVFSIILSALLVGELAGVTANATNATSNEDLDYFYDSEFVMESSARLTRNKEISYYGYLLRNDYENIKKDYTDISFSTIVYPTYYVDMYGAVNQETLFGDDAIYTINAKDTSKILLNNVESTVSFNDHNVQIIGNFNVALLGSVDIEYTGVTLMQGKLYGASVERIATNNNNSTSLISLSEVSRNNNFLSDDIRDAAREVITDFALKAEKYDYTVETYVDGIKIESIVKNATYGTQVSEIPNEKDGYVFLATKSITSGTVLANNKLVLKLYYLANPSYKISYYVMDGDANYILCKQINDLKTKYFEIVTLNDEQKKLPTDITLPVEGYKDDYIYSSSDSIVSGVNDGNLELKVCYSLSSRIVSYMKRSKGVYQLTKQLTNEVPYGYLMCGTFSNTALLSVKIPKELITLGGGNPAGGITFTDGSTLENDEGTRKAGDWVAMDIALHVKGIKTSNNIDQHCYGRAAEVKDAAQCGALYYDKNDYDNPTLINDKDRELTVVIYNDAFYVYIDDVFVTKFVTDENAPFFMPRDPNTKAGRFHAGNTYMFGVFMGSWAPSSSKISTIKEVYNADALNEIQANPRYSNITVA